MTPSNNVALSNPWDVNRLHCTPSVCLLHAVIPSWPPVSTFIFCQHGLYLSRVFVTKYLLDSIPGYLYFDQTTGGGVILIAYTSNEQATYCKGLRTRSLRGNLLRVEILLRVELDSRSDDSKINKQQTPASAGGIFFADVSCRKQAENTDAIPFFIMQYLL